MKINSLLVVILSQQKVVRLSQQLVECFML